MSLGSGGRGDELGVVLHYHRNICHHGVCHGCQAMMEGALVMVADRSVDAAVMSIKKVGVF